MIMPSQAFSSAGWSGCEGSGAARGVTRPCWLWPCGAEDRLCIRFYAPDTPAGHEVTRILETGGQLRAESDQRKWMIEDQSTGSNASSGLNPCIIQVITPRESS